MSREGLSVAMHPSPAGLSWRIIGGYCILPPTSQRRGRPVVRSHPDMRGMRPLLVLGLGLGCFVAFLLILVHRSGAGVLGVGSDAWQPLVVGIFAGTVLVATPIALLCAKDPYRPPSPGAGQAACSLVACLLLAAGWVTASWHGLDSQGTFSIAGLPWSLSGVPMGCGVGLLAVALARPFAALERRQSLACTGIALLTAALLDGLSLALPFAGLPALAILEALVAAGTPLAAQAIPAISPDRRPEGEKPAGTRLAALASDTWRPVVGALICLFIFGFTWDIGILGVQLNAPGLIVFEKIAGLALAGGTLLALSRLKGDRDPLALLFNVVLPLLVVTFIVRPYLISLDLNSMALNMLGVARETGFVLFLASAWIALTRGARRHDVSASFSAAALLVGCGAAGPLGLYGPQFLGGLLNYMGAILFTLYLVVVVVVSTVSQHAPAPAVPASSPAAPAPDLGSLVEQRCEQVAREHGLTPREGEIVLYLGRGHSYAYIANALTVSENTVRTHVRNIYRKLGVTSREELLAVVHGETGDRG